MTRYLMDISSSSIQMTPGTETAWYTSKPRGSHLNALVRTDDVSVTMRNIIL
uniref:Uncharacterized protein n=1 Tax=Picea glauca TaxID=3330 RepID=A0A101M0C9_PICGL|nr:hypothetical protein ABT39_MTgene4686 [Picea glauca]